MNDDILIWESYLKFNKILLENTQNLEAFKNNLLGAFRIVFDLDKEDINSKEIHKPYSEILGLRGYKIDYDWRCPSKANNTISAYFPIMYKNKPYIVYVHIIEWSFMPQLEDFNKYAKGIDLEHKKNPINMDSVFTCNGHVKGVIDSRRSIENTIGNIEPNYDGNFHQFFIRDGNMANLAVRVKKVIDGDDGDRNKKEINPPSSPKKNTPTSPQLVGV
jgi:hypothetical protein